VRVNGIMFEGVGRAFSDSMQRDVERAWIQTETVSDKTDHSIWKWLPWKRNGEGEHLCMASDPRYNLTRPQCHSSPDNAPRVVSPTNTCKGWELDNAGVACVRGWLGQRHMTSISGCACGCADEASQQPQTTP
jgi:hypothetical protein